MDKNRNLAGIYYVNSTGKQVKTGTSPIQLQVNRTVFFNGNCAQLSSFNYSSNLTWFRRPAAASLLWSRIKNTDVSATLEIERTNPAQIFSIQSSSFGSFSGWVTTTSGGLLNSHNTIDGRAVEAFKRSLCLYGVHVCLRVLELLIEMLRLFTEYVTHYRPLVRIACESYRKAFLQTVMSDKDIDSYFLFDFVFDKFTWFCGREASVFLSNVVVNNNYDASSQKYMLAIQPMVFIRRGIGHLNEIRIYF
ncbi:hypothetical protein CLF_105710 [Clonorchis sinensis]|uniref:Uncharacterized protein n=1 Tax=Clonorchis sinensis TaxID=79923 RepID=G7YE17_CLOSI|nr:hypothetical protein CLF_105710 [Clonorchis sinensis]